MKRFSKILAVLLTLCLLCGAIAIVSSAEAPSQTTNTDNGTTFNYTFDNDEVGKDYNSSFPSGTGSADTCTSVKVVESADGNKYVAYRYVKDANNKAYRRDFRYAVSSKTALENYSYITVDFDITADQYMVQVGYKVRRASATSSGVTTYTYRVQEDWYLFDKDVTEEEINAAIAASAETFKTQLADAVSKIKNNNTSTAKYVSAANGSYAALTADTDVDGYIASLSAYTYEKSMATKRLSYSDGAYFHFDNRFKGLLKDGTAGNGGDYVGGGYNRFYVKFKYEDGAWQLYAGYSGADKKIATLSNELGEWTHVTLAIHTVATKTETDKVNTVSYGNSMAQLFVNGEPVTAKEKLVFGSGNVLLDYITHINPRAFDFQVADWALEFSMGIDNLVTTYYTEEEAYVKDADGNPTETRDPANDVQYNSGFDAYGIDDLFREKTHTTPIYQCADVVYDKSYQAPEAADEYTQVNGGDKIYIKGAAIKAVNVAAHGSVINTTRDLLGLTPQGGNLTIECASSVNVTLSEAGSKTHNIEKTANGYYLTLKASDNQLTLPTLGSDADIVFGTYDYEDYENGETTSGTWSGGQELPGLLNYNKNAVYAAPNGNHYTALRRDFNKSAASISHNGSNGYIEWRLSKWGNSETDYRIADMIYTYDYTMVDLDFGTDSYKLQVGYRVVNSTKAKTYTIMPAYRTYTPAELTKENVEADIAAVKASFLADVEANKANLKAADIEKYSAINMTYEEALATKTLAYLEGSSMYYGMRTANNELSKVTTGTINSFMYFHCENGVWGLYGDSKYTQLLCELPENPYEFIHITFLTVADHDAKKASIYFFIEGELVSTKEGSGNLISPDGLRIQINADYKQDDAYSYAFDNLSNNYYQYGYSSGELYGLDDYVKAGDFSYAPLACYGVVYDAEYVTPDKEYIQINDGTKYYVELIFGEVLKTLKTGDVLTIQKDILGFTPEAGVEGFSVICENGAKFSLSKEALKKYVLETEDNVNYTVRTANENDAITLNWYDFDGNVAVSEKLLPGVTASADGINVDNLYVESGVYKYATGWEWDIDGDGVFTELGSFSLGDNVPEEVSVKPIGASVTMERYAIYYTVDGYNKLYGDLADYASDKGLIKMTIGAPDGATVILYQDITEMIVQKNTSTDTIFVEEGKTLSLNLNGKILYQYGEANWSNAIVTVKEGGTFNLYSSKAGGEIYQARYASGTGITAYPGVITTATDADNIEVNVGKYGEYSGDNLTIYSASIFVQQSSKITAEHPASDSEKVVFNIDGGKYYEIFKTSYALIKVAAPDVEFNIRDAFFYCSEGGIIWSDDRYLVDNAHIEIYDSVIYANNMRDVITKFHGANSTIYFEGCDLYGKIQGLASNKITLGPDNRIDVPDTASTKAFVLADGVSFAKASNGAVSIAITDFALPTFTVDASNKLTADSFRNEVALENIAMNCDLITYASNEVPESVKTVTWLDVDGSTIASEAWVAGSAVAHPEHSGVSGADYYFKLRYVWTYSDGSDASEGIVKDDIENVFKPEKVYTADAISGMKANMALLTDMSFNLYLPISDKISDLVITDSKGSMMSYEVVNVLGKDMYRISWKQAINDFAPEIVTVSYVAYGTDLSVEVALDPIKYATLVASTYECGSVEATLAYEIVNYKASVSTFVAMVNNSTFQNDRYDEFLQVFAAHENCTCVDTSVNISDEEAAVDYSALMPDVQWVQYQLSIDEIGMIIKADENAEVSVYYIGIDGEQVDLEVVYNKTAQYHIVSNVKAAYIDEIMYITVNGNTGTYCLGKFILNQPDVAVAKAIYTYAKAAEAYKHAPEK